MRGKIGKESPAFPSGRRTPTAACRRASSRGCDSRRAPRSRCGWDFPIPGASPTSESPRVACATARLQSLHQRLQSRMLPGCRRPPSPGRHARRAKMRRRNRIRSFSVRLFAATTVSPGDRSTTDPGRRTVHKGADRRSSGFLTHTCSWDAEAPEVCPRELRAARASHLCLDQSNRPSNDGCLSLDHARLRRDTCPFVALASADRSRRPSERRDHPRRRDTTTPSPVRRPPT